MRVRILWAPLLCSLFAVLGCGSGTPKPPTIPAAPTIPDNPLALVPGDAIAVVTGDLHALWDSPHGARLLTLVERVTCGAMPGITDRAVRRGTVALLASLATDRSDPDGSLAILDSEAPVTDATMQRFLQRMNDAAPTDPEATAHGGPGSPGEPAEPEGQVVAPPAAAPTDAALASHFPRVEASPRTAVRLSPTLMLAGGSAAVDASLSLLHDVEGRFERLPWLQGVALPPHQVAVYYHWPAAAGPLPGLSKQPTNEVAQRLLQHSKLTLAIELQAGLQADLTVQTASAEDAQALRVMIEQGAQQITPLLQLFRLPPLSQRLSLQLDGSTVRGRLQLPQTEVEQLLTLAETTLQPQCDPAQPEPRAHARALPAPLPQGAVAR